MEIPMENLKDYTLLFLDDERNVEDVTWVTYPEGINIVVVRNFKEFSEYLFKLNSVNLPFHLFSFDHDLGEFDKDNNEMSGLMCAKQLIKHLEDNNIKYKGSLFGISHSQNPCGRKSIEDYLKFESKVELTCHGCGHTGPDVYNDGYGFNICRVNKCTKYSVRGLSSSDF